jgi:exonuclease III
MKPRIVSWNVRELNEKDKRLRIRGLLKDWNVDILCLLEMKLEYIYGEVIRSLWDCQQRGFKWDFVNV